MSEEKKIDADHAEAVQVQPAKRAERMTNND